MIVLRLESRITDSRLLKPSKYVSFLSEITFSSSDVYPSILICGTSSFRPIFPFQYHLPRVNGLVNPVKDPWTRNEGFSDFTRTKNLSPAENGTVSDW